MNKSTKVIAICRVSTTRQEIESQKAELKSFILSDGIKEENIAWITGEGVSAVKEDDKFKANIEQVKRLIKSGEYGCVYAWELSRIARKKSTMNLLIEDLICNQVNLKIQNPSLVLLNSDGTKNNGMELAIDLFTTLAQQEMENKRERFARGKAKNKAAGLYLGGRVYYGYKIVDGRWHIDEEEADVIKRIFKMYLGGMGSQRIAKVLVAEGIIKREHPKSQDAFVRTILHSERYTGENKMYPQIVNVEDYYKVQDMMAEWHKLPRTRHNNNYLGRRLIKSGKYLCGCSAKECAYREETTSISANANMVDSVLLYEANRLQTYIGENPETIIKECEGAMKAAERTIQVNEAKIADYRKSIEKVEERLIKGKLTDEKADAMEATFEDGIKECDENIKVAKDQIMTLEERIQSAERGDTIRYIYALDRDEMAVEIRKYIKGADIVKLKPSVYELTIHSITDTDELYKIDTKRHQCEVYDEYFGWCPIKDFKVMKMYQPRPNRKRKTTAE